MKHVHIFTLIILLKFRANLSSPIKEYDESSVELHDQRQNGTENYRLDMKDVVIVISPLDTLFSAVSGADSVLKPDTGSDLSQLTFLADLKHLDGNAPEIDSSYQRKPVKKW